MTHKPRPRPKQPELKTFEVWEQLPSIKAESEEDARANKLPKGRVFKVEEVTK